MQTPVVPKWLVWALLGLLALLALLLLLWFTVLEPTIESQAEEAAEEAAAEAEEAADDAEKAAQEAGGAATDAQKAADDAEAGGREPAGGPPPPGSAEPRVRTADISPRLNVVTSTTDVDTFDLEGPDDTFDLTDVVFNNPQGDFGRVQLVVDDDVLLEHALENFRDLDFHFVSPIRVTDSVVLRVLCRSPGRPPDAPVPTSCDVSVLMGGEQVRPIVP